jgi:arylsulfatase A-like enzyme
MKADPMKNSQPNILYVCTDQQSIRVMGAYGNKHVRTPNMDALAAGGVRFNNSYCPAPVCSPSRASIATGKMPHEVGVNKNSDPMKEGILSMGEIFQQAGYETAWTGKWHNRDPYPQDQSIPGFTNLPAGGLLGGNSDTEVTDRAIKFLSRKHDQPFFLGVALHNPHDICHTIPICKYLPDVPGEWLAQSDLPPLPKNHLRDINEPEFISRSRHRSYYGEENVHTQGWTEVHWRSYLHAYYRMVEAVDKEVGRITSALRDNGLEENTLIVFTSDHGEGMAAHEWVVKLMLYEECVAVPLMLQCPDVISPGTSNDHLASGIDILPTLCDYAGISSPVCTGVSLRPVIDDPLANGREFVVVELDTTEPQMTARMVRTPQYKYMAFAQGNRSEMLFDCEKDPGEMHNLAQDPDFFDEVARHRDILRRWIDQTADDFTCETLL